MADLLDLLDDWTDAPAWVPLYRPSRVTLASLTVDDRCRDCGCRSGFNQGGAGADIGVFMVCDDCAKIDDCRPAQRGAEWHASHWGEVHPAVEHDALVAAQARRRARYRAKHPDHAIGS